MKKQLSYSITIPAIFCAAMGFFTNAATAEEPFLPPLPEGKTWKLAWSDEFEGTQIDPSKWEIMGDWRRRDGFWVKEDAYLDGTGNLILRTKKAGERYTCGAMRTQGKFEHKFGYWVCRCKFPTQEGHWPAFWLFARPGVGKVGDEGRDGTEIDIMEKPWREDKITEPPLGRLRQGAQKRWERANYDPGRQPGLSHVRIALDGGRICLLC